MKTCPACNKEKKLSAIYKGIPFCSGCVVSQEKITAKLVLFKGSLEKHGPKHAETKKLDKEIEEIFTKNNTAMRNLISQHGEVGIERIKIENSNE